MRYKYNSELFREVFIQRMKIVDKIYDYFLSEYSILKQEMPNVLYSVFAQIPQIDIVIRHGSNLQQIMNNSKQRQLDSGDIFSLIEKMKHDWEYNYV